MREAARGVASELLSGRLKAPWLMRSGGWIIMAIGLGLITAGIAVHSVSHRVGELGVFYLAEGAAGVLFGVVGIFWAPRQMRRNLARLEENHASGRSSGPPSTGPG